MGTPPTLFFFFFLSAADAHHWEYSETNISVHQMNTLRCKDRTELSFRVCLDYVLPFFWGFALSTSAAFLPNKRVCRDKLHMHVMQLRLLYLTQHWEIRVERQRLQVLPSIDIAAFKISVFVLQTEADITSCKRIWKNRNFSLWFSKQVTLSWRNLGPRW